MTHYNIRVEELETILSREEALRDGSPEHTLDWYTYDNRVSLLKEVIALSPKLNVKAEKPKVEKLKGDVKQVKVEETPSIKSEEKAEAKKEDTVKAVDKKAKDTKKDTDKD